MASITIIGIIDAVKYMPNNGGCIVFLSEYKHGYKKSDGTRVEDKYMSWRCLFKQGLVKYVSGHFSNGMVVEIKGEVFPYAISHGETVDGYSVMAQTMNMFSVPRIALREERKMIKESLSAATELPDPDAYNQPDF